MQVAVLIALLYGPITPAELEAQSDLRFSRVVHKRHRIKGSVFGMLKIALLETHRLIHLLGHILHRYTFHSIFELRWTVIIARKSV
jgi:hypothetical protein